MNNPSMSDGGVPGTTHVLEPAARERFVKPDNQSQSGRKLAVVILMMVALACLLWMAFHFMRFRFRDEPPPRPESAVSSIATIKLPALPEQPPRKAPVDDRYAQLMAYLNERFSAYDKLLRRPEPTSVRPPDPPSVIFTRGETGGLRPWAGSDDAQRSPSYPATPSPDLATMQGLEEQQAVLAAAGLGSLRVPPVKGVDDLLKPSVLQGERAAKMSNRSFLLAQGTNLECVLETAIDTTVPGLTTCILSRDVYSDDSRVLLLEKGSKLVGEYRGSLRNGDERLFLIWSRVVTPMGVAIRLNSPGTDVLGRAGVDGYIDNRYFERFGNALLVSILADALPRVVESVSDKLIHAARLDDNGQNSQSGQATSSAGNQMGAEIIRQGVLVPPVLRKNQGDKVSILVSRDLDFSSIYSLALRR